MKITFSFDDGHELDKKIIELLVKYGFRDVIFFIPIISWGFDNLGIYKDYKIGGHTYGHPNDLKLLNERQLDIQIDETKKILEAKVGYQLEWFCYPRGRYNQRIIERVKEAGFKRARTTQIGIGGTPFELKGYHLYQRKEYENIDWYKYIIKIIDKNPFRWIHIWGHSWEIDKNKEWNKLEKLFKTINEDFSC